MIKVLASFMAKHGVKVSPLLRGLVEEGITAE